MTRRSPGVTRGPEEVPPPASGSTCSKGNRGRQHRSRILATLDVVDCGTPTEVAGITGLPVREVRRVLLDLHRAGRVVRVVLPEGVLYAPVHGERAA